MVTVEQLLLVPFPLQTRDQSVLVVGGHDLWIRSGQIDHVHADRSLDRREGDELFLGRNGNVIDGSVHVLDDLQEHDGG